MTDVADTAEPATDKPAAREPRPAAAGAPPPQPSTPRRALRLVGEATWVMLAVLLAFAADQWREGQGHKKLADRALRGIVEEIRANRGTVSYFLPRHEALRANLPDRPEDWTPPAFEDEENRFDPIVLRDTAWRTALETNALVHIDYQTVRLLTDAYTFQEAYAELTRDLLRTSFDLDRHDPSRLEANFEATRFFLYIFVENEKALLQTYDRVLAELDVTANPRQPEPAR
ncbi:MAG: hypothetical protein AAFX50_15035 [Acidobacteriota bacterium]